MSASIVAEGNQSGEIVACAGESREDLPLKGGAGGSSGCGSGCAGLRLILGCFGALSAAVTLALLTQIYYGDYQLVPHGSVASDAASCSRAGTDALKAGGGSVDAAVAAALCLAVVSPHCAGLDSSVNYSIIFYIEAFSNNASTTTVICTFWSGSMLVWNYRSSSARNPPRLFTWGGGGRLRTRTGKAEVALAHLHERFGRLPWASLVRHGEGLARKGFPVSWTLAESVGLHWQKARGLIPTGEAPRVGSTLVLPSLADHLLWLSSNTTRELSSRSEVIESEASAALVGGWRLWGERSRVWPLARAMAAATVDADADVSGDRPPDSDAAAFRIASHLHEWWLSGDWREGDADGVSTNIAVVDREDVYVSLVMGLSSPFGSGKLAEGGYFVDSEDAGAGAGAPNETTSNTNNQLNLTPLVLTEANRCGRRYITGGGCSAALAQVLAALTFEGKDGGGLIPAIEKPRFQLLSDGQLGVEYERQRSFSESALRYLSSVASLTNLSAPYCSLNVVRQSGDILASHADSRGGGLASRY